MSYTFKEDNGDGTYRTYEFDERGNLIRTGRHQHMSLVMDACEEAKKTTNNGYSDSREMQLVGYLPIAMANQMHATGEIWDDKYMAKNFWNNSDYSAFRIGGGHI